MLMVRENRYESSVRDVRPLLDGLEVARAIWWSESGPKTDV